MEEDYRSGMQFAEKLRQLRQFNLLSQEALAEKSGISIRTIQRLEKGNARASAYTLQAIERVLDIKPGKLIIQDSNTEHKLDPLKLLNLSALVILVLPLGNLILPFWIYWKNTANKEILQTGLKIISFHILWTLGTVLVSLILPLLLLGIFPSLHGAGIPLFLPVYLLCVMINVFYIIRISIQINKRQAILEKIPNIL